LQDAPGPGILASVKTCPECAEEVKEAARKCRFCGHRFDADGPRSSSSSGPAERPVAPPPKKRPARWPWVVLGLAIVAAIGVVAIPLTAEEDRDCVSDTTGEPVGCDEAGALPAGSSTGTDAGPAESTAAEAERDIERETERLAKGELQRTITKDARKQVADGLLEGPILKTSCQRVGGGSGATKRYECIAVTARSGGTESGYSYEATANTENGRITWKLAGF